MYQMLQIKYFEPDFSYRDELQNDLEKYKSILRAGLSVFVTAEIN